jgi:hypothetical protein
MILSDPTFSSTFLGFHFRATATFVPPAGENKISCNFNGLFRYAGLGEIIRFDDFVEMEKEFFNKWFEL